VGGYRHNRGVSKETASLPAVIVDIVREKTFDSTNQAEFKNGLHIAANHARQDIKGARLRMYSYLCPSSCPYRLYE
jgi:hypothetical protein